MYFNLEFIDTQNNEWMGVRQLDLRLLIMGSVGGA